MIYCDQKFYTSNFHDSSVWEVAAIQRLIEKT
jgi:hypothetical protein